MLLFSSCAYGPKTEKKSPMNVLNGDQYKSGVDVLGIPIVERQRKDTTIKGSCFFLKDGDDFRYPVKFQKLTLSRGNLVLDTQNTNDRGEFTFSHYLENGKYILKIESKNFHGSMEIKVDSYLISNLAFKVSK